jgi:hypothetical protein
LPYSACSIRRRSVTSKPTRTTYRRVPWESARFQGIVEDRDNLLLEHRSHVDQNVAAADQVQAREQRVHRKVLPGENAAFAHRFRNLIAAVCPYEEATEALGRDVAEAAVGMGARPCPLDGAFADVRAEYLDRRAVGPVAEVLQKHDRHGVRLLAGRAARDPDTDGLALGLVVQNLWKEHVPERLE